jgi:hypothetical protein
MPAALVLEKSKSRKLCVAASELVAPALTCTLPGKLALAALFALGQSPERVPETRVGIPSSHSRALTLTYTVHGRGLASERPAF